MKICLLAESAQNPVLASALSRLAERHQVLVRDPQTIPNVPFEHRSEELRDVDLYLLKSRSPEARVFARKAERNGALVLNTPHATSSALNRERMATLLSRGGVPTPKTWAFDRIGDIAQCASNLPWPMVVKSRISRRGDLVTRIDNVHDLLELLPAWGNEPAIVQEFAPNDGFDLKFWVIGSQVSVARRPCALESRDTGQDVPIDPAELPAEWVQVALRAGAALGLDLFGVDLLITDDRPVVIDVNAFPGFRGAPAAATSLVELIEHRAAERRLCA
jgi:ribosomal protein S6--L-glutamate ligase